MTSLGLQIGKFAESTFFPFFSFMDSRHHSFSLFATKFEEMIFYAKLERFNLYSGMRIRMNRVYFRQNVMKSYFNNSILLLFARHCFRNRVSTLFAFLGACFVSYISRI